MLPTKQQRVNILYSKFKNTKRGYDIKSLYDFRNPLYGIQPAVVCNGFEWSEETKDGGLSLDGNTLSTYLLDKMKEYVLESKDEPNIGKKINGEYETNERGVEKATTVEVTASTNSYSINEELANAVKEGEKTAGTKPFDSPIYIVVFGKVAGGHSSILFYADGKLYSLGLGYLGAKESKVAGLAKKILGGEIVANASLYSPDYLIAPWGGKEDAAGNLVPFSYQIADIGILKQKHLDRIQKFLETANTEELYVVFRPLLVKDKKTEKEYYRYKFQNFNIDLNKTYNMVSRAADDKYNNINCTTFVETIFRERVNCIYSDKLYISLPSHPLSCKSRILTDPVDTFKRYMKAYIEGFPRDAASNTLYNELIQEVTSTKVAVAPTTTATVATQGNGVKQRKPTKKTTTISSAVEENRRPAWRRAYNCTFGKLCPLKPYKGGKTRKLKRKQRTTRRR